MHSWIFRPYMLMYRLCALADMHLRMFAEAGRSQCGTAGIMMLFKYFAYKKDWFILRGGVYWLSWISLSLEELFYRRTNQ